MELRAQIAAITSSSKEGEQAEAEAGEGTGPQVNDQHIADIVAQWTGIPIDKVHTLGRATSSLIKGCAGISTPQRAGSLHHGRLISETVPSNC